VSKDATVAQRVMDHRSWHFCTPLGALLVEDDEGTTQTPMQSRKHAILRLD
jgi:hypothetical protein